VILICHFSLHPKGENPNPQAGMPRSVVMRKPRTGQYRFNLDTGKVYVVESKATETPNLEGQASLLQWGGDMVKLRLWQ
jgi:hypothetical protein